MDSFLEEEEAVAAAAAAAKSPAGQVGSALLPALHLPFLPPHLYQPGKGGAARPRPWRLPRVPALPPRLPVLRRPSSPLPALRGERRPLPPLCPAPVSLACPRPSPRRRLGFPVPSVVLLRRAGSSACLAACEALGGGLYAAGKIRAE